MILKSRHCFFFDYFDVETILVDLIDIKTGLFDFIDIETVLFDQIDIKIGLSLDLILRQDFYQIDIKQFFLID